MTKRSMPVKGDSFMVDGIDPAPDGNGTPFFAVQRIDKDHGNRKYMQVLWQDGGGVLHESIRDDDMIGAGTIYVRTNGTACVIGGGRDKTIVVSADIPEWVPRVTNEALVGMLRAKGLV